MCVLLSVVLFSSCCGDGVRIHVCILCCYLGLVTIGQFAWPSFQMLDNLTTLNFSVPRVKESF